MDDLNRAYVYFPEKFDKTYKKINRDFLTKSAWMAPSTMEKTSQD